MQHTYFIFFPGCPFIHLTKRIYKRWISHFYYNAKCLKLVYIYYFQANFCLSCRTKKTPHWLFIPLSVSFSLQSVASWLLFMHPSGEAPETEGRFHDWNCEEQTFQETRCVIFLMLEPQTNIRLTKQPLALAPSWLKGKIPLKGLLYSCSSPSHKKVDCCSHYFYDQLLCFKGFILIQFSG